MSITIVRTCDYDGGCSESETLTADYDGYVREYDEDGDLVEEMPIEVVGDICWCDYQPEKHPADQYLCRAHERQIREERGIRLRA